MDQRDYRALFVYEFITKGDDDCDYWGTEGEDEREFVPCSCTVSRMQVIPEGFGEYDTIYDFRLKDPREMGYIIIIEAPILHTTQTDVITNIVAEFGFHVESEDMHPLLSLCSPFLKNGGVTIDRATPHMHVFENRIKDLLIASKEVPEQKECPHVGRKRKNK
jgi:hypothetical protein